MLTSLGLTLACLSALMVLVAVCTLAQAEMDSWEAVAITMRRWFVRWTVPGTSLSVPVFPGGVLVGLVLAANLVAAQVSRFELSWRKAGIWITHAGLLVLLLGEFVSGAFQVDMQMAIEEGQTVAFLESPRELELAVIDATDPDREVVHRVPESALARGGSVEVPGTPLSLEVKRYFRNADLAVRAAGDPPPLATAGVGPSVAVRQLPPATTADGQRNLAAWVEPVAAGQRYGTWLVSNALRPRQSFSHQGRTYRLAMRPRRVDLPYAITLKDFRHDLYPGTDIPKNFSSLLHLSNRSTGEERDVLIYMNHPLRYDGKAFYQASFGKSDTLSILQVVENPGWLLPYLSAALVALGLLVQFGISLRRAVRRGAAGSAPPALAPARPQDSPPAIGRLAPWLAGALAVGLAAGALAPPGEVRGLDLDAFGRLPVLEGGRVKPIDSVARNALLAIRGQQGFRSGGRAIAADEWLLDAMFRPEVADAQPVFAIDDPEVLGLMGLRQTSDRYVSARTLAPHLKEVERQAAAARSVDPKRRNRFQGALVNLHDRVYLYYRLRNTVQLARGRALLQEIADARSPEAARRQATLAELAYFRAMPPANGRGGDAWRSAGEALRAAAAGEVDPSLEVWGRLASAYRSQDPSAFNRAATDLQRHAAAAAPEAASRTSRELLFNRAQPFYTGMAIYLAALLVLFASWAWKHPAVRRTAFALLAAGAVVHTAGLVARIVLQGRPPVTNLYSSAVFVGWAAVVVGMVLERMRRRGFGTAVAATSGFASLILAHHLAGGGDTMEMMRAVLDSNFWLATHVVAITVGYSGTFLAGVLAIGYAVRRHLLRQPDEAGARALVTTTYGVVCFALFFSFLGTVLGGIWADQSWGRFWGWDPKENGALLIVLWNALILHARWGGYVREKGIMAMAIVGNVITSLSWFGVNMLGVGLHSYGFMDRAFWALLGFIASQGVFLALALAPPRFWARAPASAPHGSPTLPAARPVARLHPAHDRAPARPAGGRRP